LHYSVTKESVDFAYDLRSNLKINSSKTYSHTFPNFANWNGNFEAFDSEMSSPIDLYKTRWMTGRASFTYNVSQTTFSRHDLKSITTNRGEDVQFLYGLQKAEIVGDVLCDEIRVNRSGKLHRGWKLGYDVQYGDPNNLSCTLYETSGPNPPYYSIPNENVFNLGNLYTLGNGDAAFYFFIHLNIGCLNVPFRIPFTRTPLEIVDGGKSAMSEFGSVLDVKRLGGEVFNEFEEQAIFNAEAGRSFLIKVEEITRPIEGQGEGCVDFVTDIQYYKGEIPRRFSMDQDLFGFPIDNSLSNSPFPAISYANIYGNPIQTTNNIVPKQVAFYHEDSPNNFHLGQKSDIDLQSTSDLAFAQMGAIQKIELATGASINFRYEPNQLPNFDRMGGLRVSQLIEDPFDSPLKITDYSYQIPTWVTAPVRIFQTPMSVFWEDKEQKVYVTSNCQNPMLMNRNNYVGYGTVIEDWGAEYGSIKHEYSNPNDRLLPAENTSVAQLRYAEAVIRIGKDCEVINATCSNNSNDPNGIDFGVTPNANNYPPPPSLEFPVEAYEPWQVGQETDRYVYDGDDVLRQEVHNTFKQYGSNGNGIGSLTYTKGLMYQDNYSGTFVENYV
ncbi:MAG: hypothetical protein AAFU60_08890, partial [Bacteroidota bacterium]